MYVCNCHTLLQTGLKITNRQHTRHSLFFNHQSPCVYRYLVFLTYHLPVQQEIWLVVHSRSNLIGVTYIHLSLTHSTYLGVEMTSSGRYTYAREILSKKAAKVLLIIKDPFLTQIQQLLRLRTNFSMPLLNPCYFMHVKFGDQNYCRTERILIKAQLNKSTLSSVNKH